MNRMTVGSIWRNIDPEDEVDFGRLCMIMSIDTEPDHNGDGTIELLYSDGLTHYGKVRRFIPGITHKYVRQSKIRKELG